LVVILIRRLTQKNLHFDLAPIILSGVRQLTDAAKNLHFAPQPKQLPILRGVYPERKLQTLRFAQSDNQRRAHDDMRGSYLHRAAAHQRPLGREAASYSNVL